MGLYGDIAKDVLVSTLPIAGILLFLQLILLSPSPNDVLLFCITIILVLVGFSIFLIGVEIGINPVGGAIGSEIPKRRSKFFMVAVVFIISFLVTVAEPDVAVFASQVTEMFASLSTNTLVYSIAAGVAIFLILATVRIVFKLSLKWMLTIGYALTLILLLITPEEFIGIAFDSGGVTTGPMTVPILLSLGIGICSVGKYRNELDGFGMVGLASIGPIIALLILGITSNLEVASTAGGSSYDPYIHDLFGRFMAELPHVVYSVVVSIIPLTIFFAWFQRTFLRFTWNAVKNMLYGLTVAGIGVIIFLTAIYVGFIPVSSDIGAQLADSPLILVLLGALLGFLVAFAEPAVTILSGRVENASGGNIPKKTVKMVISAGVAFFVAIGMLKISFDFNLMYILIPGYILAIILMWKGDKDLIGITFDAGGVATGPMSVAVIGTMYTAISAANYTGVTAVINGFGVIALIALSPLVFLGLFSVYINKMKGLA